MTGGIADGSVGNLASEMSGLDITDSGPQQPRPLIAAIGEREQTVDSLKQQLANFKTLLVDNSLTNGDVTTTCRVSEQVNSIRNVAQCLNKCPSGPTLFIPLKDLSSSGSPLSTGEDPPRYLFMPYDFASPGTNSKDIFTSEAHDSHGSAHSKKDIFSMGTDGASKMLHLHLDGPEARTDNLVTWSRSLLFVVQASVHRCCNTHGRSPSRMFICILDTSKFPKGQFASAKW
ncbi:unnamed protein product [Fusarium equiseti]|uniref:Uncharacterized protein n=1 Tax=Fusarium equiseti TaxID=61235 RepID=A0A8J2JF37_FUSEQ|nr:unnamed protein product [Fusarium equiseti]